MIAHSQAAENAPKYFVWSPPLHELLACKSLKSSQTGGGEGLGGGGEGNGGGGLGDGEGGLGDRTRPSNGDCGGDGMPTTAISTGSHCSGQALTKERDSGLLGGPTASE